MAKLSLTLFLCLVPLPAPPTSSPKELIVGKWEGTTEKDKGNIIEFTSDGKLNMRLKDVPAGFKIEGTYKFLADDEIEVAIKFSGGGLPEPVTKTEKLKIQLTKDELTTTDSQKRIDKMKRVK